MWVCIYNVFQWLPRALRLKSKLFYQAFKAFLIWPLPVLHTDYLFKHPYSGHIRYSLFLSTLHFPLHAFAYAHSPSGAIPHPSRPGSNAFFSPQAVSHFILLCIPYPSSPVHYVYLHSDSLIALLGSLRAGTLSNSLSSLSPAMTPHQNQAELACVGRGWAKSAEVSFFLVY